MQIVVNGEDREVAEGIKIGTLLKELGIKVQGPGSGRETAVKSVGAHEGIKVTFFKDITPLPHNGCRPPKRRRV